LPSDVIYGNTEWAAGYSNEEAGEETAAEKPNPFVDTVAAAEGWSLFQKAALFGVILGAIAIYLRMTRQRGERTDVGYEKTLA
jgi:hypothetical protein